MKPLLTKIFNRLNTHLYPYHSYGKSSYSQCGEDLIINHIFKQIGIEKPSYIDIGAHHPFYLNNTAFFYLKGSKGINIEPDPNLFNAFVDERNRDINLNIGIGLKIETADFYIMSEPTLNTFIKEEADRAIKEHALYNIKEIKKLSIEPLNDILKKYWEGKFPDFMSLDVEGLDDQIIRSLTYETEKPKVICVETISFSYTGKGVKNEKIIDFLKSKDYILYADTNINSIFVDRKLWER